MGLGFRGLGPLGFRVWGLGFNMALEAFSGDSKGPVMVHIGYIVRI